MFNRVMYLRSVHVRMCSSLLRVADFGPWCACPTMFYPLTIWRALGCNQLLAIMSKVGINVHLQISMWYNFLFLLDNA